MAAADQPEQQRITGAALPDITDAEAADAIAHRDAVIASQVKTEQPKGGVY